MVVKNRNAALVLEASLVLTAVFWGTNYVAVKYVAGHVPPLLFVALRFVVAGTVVWGFLRLSEPKSVLRRADVLPMLCLGFFGVALCQTTFTYGLSLTSASNTGFIFATAPVWGLLLGFVLGQERPTWRGVIGVGLCVLGVGSIFYRGLGAQGGSLAGDLLILASAVLLGVYTVLSLPLLRRLSPLAVAAYPMLFGGLMVLPLASPGFARVDWSSLAPGVAAAFAYSALLATAFAFVTWQRGISRIGANKVFVYQYLITLSGILSGVVLLGETLGAHKLLGGLVVLVGVYLARRQ